MTSSCFLLLLLVLLPSATAAAISVSVVTVAAAASGGRAGVASAPLGFLAIGVRWALSIELLARGGGSVAATCADVGNGGTLAAAAGDVAAPSLA